MSDQDYNPTLSEGSDQEDEVDRQGPMDIFDPYFHGFKADAEDVTEGMENLTITDEQYALIQQEIYEEEISTPLDRLLEPDEVEEALEEGYD